MSWLTSIVTSNLWAQWGQAGQWGAQLQQQQLNQNQNSPKVRQYSYSSSREFSSHAQEVQYTIWLQKSTASRSGVLASTSKDDGNIVPPHGKRNDPLAHN